MLMDGIQNTKETSELIILMHKAAIARDICALTVATLRGAIIYPKTTVYCTLVLGVSDVTMVLASSTLAWVVRQ
jgi:hypothetical protein